MSDVRTRRPWQRLLAASVAQAGPAVAKAGLTDDGLEAALQAAELFEYRAPEGYLALADWTDPDDPILRQVLPRAEELMAAEGFVDDAVGDLAAHPAPGLVHKYAGRALLVLTGSCAVNCRFCFRRAYPYSELREDGVELALQELARDTSVSEVILSGGDPLTLTDAALIRLLDRLEAMPHLRRLRVHSRVPVVLPERITDELVNILTNRRLQPWMVTHFNHPRELRSEAVDACRRLQRAGIPVLNQAVLLRGVNDDEETLVELFEGLVDVGVKPYYLHQLDRVTGTAHFEVPEARGRALMEALRGRLTGIALPRWVRDVAGATSKLPLAMLLVALVGCSAPEPAEPQRSGLSGVKAADVSTPTPPPTPRPTPRRSTPNSELAPLPAAERILTADLNGTGTPIVFVGTGKVIRWGHWPDDAPEPVQTGHFDAAGVLQSWIAADLDGDGMEEVVAAFGVGRGAVGAPLEVVLIERTGKAVITRVLWTSKGDRNQAASMGVWPREDGTSDVYVAAYTSRFDVGGAVVSRAGGLVRWLDGHSVRMGSARAVADFDGDGKQEVAVGRMYGDTSDADGDLRVIQDDGSVETVPTLRGVRAVGAADLDGDGKAELLFGDGWHKNYGKFARYRPSIARRGADGAWAVTLIEEGKDQYTVESIGADGGRIVAGGNRSVAVYESKGSEWTVVGGSVRSSTQGAWARLRQGVYVVGGPKPNRFKR
jgi:EF-P beta-lysylation protein EpmB